MKAVSPGFYIEPSQEKRDLVTARSVIKGTVPTYY